MTRALLAVGLAVAGCGGASARVAMLPADAHYVTLFRDRAVVRQRVEVELRAGAATTVRVRLPPDLAASDVQVFGREHFAHVELRQLEAPGDFELVVAAARPQRTAVYLGYTTAHLPWQADYTLTTTAARTSGVLRGALAVRNATGVDLKRARVRLVDAKLGTLAARTAERLRQDVTAIPTSTTPVAPPRELGTADLVAGEVRLELLGAGAPRPLRSTLVYDPIGTELDRDGEEPDHSPTLGVLAQPRPRVSESLELTRDAAATAGLPGGAVRLFERRGDGSLVVLGESRIFDSATLVAAADTVSIGTAEGVTGKREQRDLTDDADRRRLTEELRVTLTNARAVPVEVVVREHLYRTERDWTIPYASHPPTKEGPQQVAMRVTVPAKGSTSVTYVVVYAWEPK